MAYLTYSPRTPQGARISRKQYHGTSDLVVVPDVWFRVYVARKVKVVLLCVSRGQVQVWARGLSQGSSGCQVRHSNVSVTSVSKLYKV